jgi:hypothetical protein
MAKSVKQQQHDYMLALDANNSLHLMQIFVDRKKRIRNNPSSINVTLHV